MLFLARVLHLPDGGLQRGMVVCTEKSVVKDIYPFVNEVHSMALVDELFLSPVATIKSVDEIKKISHLENGERLYAYGLNAAGELLRLG